MLFWYTIWYAISIRLQYTDMQKIFIAGVVLATLLAGVAVYLLLRNEPMVADTEVVQTMPVKEVRDSAVPTQGTDTLRSLLARNQDLECAVVYNENTTASSTIEGTSFMSRGRMRGDFIVPELGPENVSSMIITDTTLYAWTEIQGEKYGIKADLVSLATTTALDTHEPVPLDASVEYMCRLWPVVDGSVFEVPADVLFTDFGSVMTQGMEYGTVYEETAEANACTACATLPPTLQGQCRINLQCE